MPGDGLKLRWVHLLGKTKASKMLWCNWTAIKWLHSKDNNSVVSDNQATGQALEIKRQNLSDLMCISRYCFDLPRIVASAGCKSIANRLRNQVQCWPGKNAIRDEKSLQIKVKQWLTIWPLKHLGLAHSSRANLSNLITKLPVWCGSWPALPSDVIV